MSVLQDSDKDTKGDNTMIIRIALIFFTIDLCLGKHNELKNVIGVYLSK